MAAAEQLLLNRDAVNRLLKENLCQSQTRMNQQADRHRSEQAFEVGDMVYGDYNLSSKHLYQYE